MCSERQFSLVQFTSADVNPGLELQGPDSGLGRGGRDDSFFSERRYASAVITMAYLCLSDTDWCSNETSKRIELVLAWRRFILDCFKEIEK